MTAKTLPPGVEDLSVAARWIYCEIRHDGQIGIEDLRRRTGLDVSTIRRRTTDLEERDLIESRWRDDDPRERVFCLRD